MMKTAKQKIAELSPSMRKEVMARAAELIAEEKSLRDLRLARERTQVQVAKELGINQNSVSKLEQRTDLMLSTLAGYVKAMGGRLRLLVEFPDRPAVWLTGLEAIGRSGTGKLKRR